MNYDGSIGSDREYDDDLIGGDSDLWDEYDADDEYDGDPGWADGDHDSAMASIGWGTDEDYGYFGGDEDFGGEW